MIDTLILLKLKDVYAKMAKFQITVEFFCTDWLMCLGMNVIPLEYSVGRCFCLNIEGHDAYLPS